jgi:hypothetical protein
MENGQIRPLDKAMLETLGEWGKIYYEALYLPRPTGIEIENKPKNFILKGEGCYYFFAHDINMVADENVERSSGVVDHNNRFKLEEKIKSVKWLDNGEAVSFTQNGNDVAIVTTPERYGEQLVVKIAKIEI